ncbi:MAG TPA: hypothetical protein VK066_19215 [Chloroflexota bacterium]|nr:hypothetical protein [Chloroflexota bacterium]
MNPKDQRELDELQSAEMWDWEKGETHPGESDPTMELVVSFSRADLRAVAAAARRAGLNSAQFVRRAAVDAAHAASAEPIEGRR